MRKSALSIVCLVFPILLAAQTRSLEYYLKAAAASNPLIADYTNQLEAARYDSLIMRASFRPQVNINGNILQSPSIGGEQYDIDIVNPSEYTLVGEVTQDILLGKNRDLRYRSITANRNLTAISAKLSLREIKKAITDQYLVAWSDFNQLKFAKENLELMKSSQEILRPMVDKGIYRATDYLAFTIETQSELINLSRLKFQYKNDIDSLNLVCGIMDTTLYDLAAPAIDPRINEAGAFLLFPKFSADSLRITAERDLLALRYKPHLSWFANAGLNAVDLGTAYRNFGTSFGISLTVPIYDGGQRNFEFKKLDLEENTRSIYSNYYRSQYKLRMWQLRQDLEINASILKQYREQLKLAQNLIELSGKQLNKGEISVTDFLNAIRSYKSIQAEMNNVELKQAELASELSFLNNY
jgi:outer membrane protein TolC